MASNGHGFVAVWDDQRMQEYSSFTVGYAAYATRVDETGHAVNSLGIQIGSPLSYRPSIASNGHGYLASYNTGRGQSWVVPLDDDAHPAAAAREVSPREIYDLASNGATYCALVSGYAHSDAILLDEQGASVASIPIDGWSAAITSAAGRYIVLTIQETRIVATTISPAGFVLDQRTLADAGTDYIIVAAASNGSRALVTWYAQSNDERHIDSVMLYGHGAPIDGIRRIYGADGAPYRGAILGPSLAWDGKSFLVLWNDDGLHAMPVSDDGHLLDDEPIALGSIDAERFGAAFDGQHALLVSAERHSSLNDPVARVLPSFNTLKSLPQANVISFSPQPQREPDLALTTSGVALAVAREGEGYGAITGSLFSPVAAGNETQFTIAGARSNTLLDGPSVAAANDLFLAAWREASDVGTRILARRVSLNGAMLDPGPLVLAVEPRSYANFADTDIAFDGENFLVAWHAQDDEIRVRGINAKTGTFTGPALTVSRHDASEQRERRTPAVVWTGETYLIAWSESLPLVGGVSETNPLRNVYRIARVTKDGTLLDTNESPTLYTVDGYSHGTVLAKGTDRVLLVTATGAYLSSSKWYVHAQLFDLAGNPVGEAQRIDSAEEVKRIHPAAAWNGKSFSVFWTEQAGGLSGGQSALAGVRLNAGGTIDDRIDCGNAKSFSPAAVSVDHGALIVELQIAPDQGNVARLYTRTFVALPPRGRVVRH